ncbi:MAG: SGNH/GDSL hydrolase family protein, partial [Acidimicrobiales bacterium]
EAIAMAHQAGKRIIGVTLLPRSTDPIELWTPSDQAALEQVDNWTRHSSGFDGVLDLAPVVADVYNGQCAPLQLFPPYDSGDHLHPNAAGQTAIADSIDGSVLQLPSLPKMPLLVHVTPTSRCVAIPPAPVPTG